MRGDHRRAFDAEDMRRLADGVLDVCLCQSFGCIEDQRSSMVVRLEDCLKDKLSDYRSNANVGVHAWQRGVYLYQLGMQKAPDSTTSERRCMASQSSYDPIVPCLDSRCGQ